MWGYLCVLGGMGYEGGPIEGLGGWGDGGSPRQTLLIALYTTYCTQCKAIVPSRFSERGLYVHSNSTVG
jgi:hypothetical protein